MLGIDQSDRGVYGETMGAEPPTHRAAELIPLCELDAGDGSVLVVGVFDQERQPETNASKDAPLLLWRERREPWEPPTNVPEEEPRHLVHGRLNPIYPIMIGGREHIVFAGEVDAAVDHVLLFYTKPGEQPDRQYLGVVSEPLGRRIWISHPEPWQPALHVQMCWLHGHPEHVTLGQEGWSKDD